MIFSNKDIRAFEFQIIEAKIDSQSLKPQGTNVYITLSGGTIRFRLDGGIPNSTQGHILSDRQSIELLNKSNIEKFQFVQASNIPSTLTVTYGEP